MLTKELELLNTSLPEGDISVSRLSAEIGAYEIENTQDHDLPLAFEYDKRLIHFLFSLSGEIGLSEKTVKEKVVLNSKNYFMFTNPRENIILETIIPPAGKVLAIMISMKELHSIFGSSFGSDQTIVNNFMESYKMKQLFNELPMTPSIAVIAHQFFNSINRRSVRKIYQHGKVMEFLSLNMDSPNSRDEVQDQCPFVMDAEEMARIKEAKDIIIDNMMNPPSLRELAHMVGTNEFKLKVGFRSIFGTTVYGYLSDYRMDQARKLLTVDKVRIKEIATEVGYSNPSHFIAAYKRKYGVTPKQHLKSLVA